MSWFKVDDALHRSLKRLKVSTKAMGLWVCAGSWSRESKTGGYIPREALRTISPDLSLDESSALAEELVAARIEGIHENGFWIPMANGWQFHDWEQFQPEDEIETERREKIRDIRREAGRAGAQARWQKDGKNSFANANYGNPGIPHTPAREDPPSGSDPVSRLEDDSDPEQSLSGPSQPKDLTGSARANDGKPTAPASAKSPFKTDNERRVFEYWAKTVWRKVHREGVARATPKRVSPIRARLRENISPELLERVCDNVAASAWHMGENDGGKAHYETHLIFRNREKVEWWLTQKAPKPPGAVEHERQQAAEDARLVEQAKRGEYGPKAQATAQAGRLTGDVLKRFKEAIRAGDLKRRGPAPAGGAMQSVLSGMRPT